MSWSFWLRDSLKSDNDTRFVRVKARRKNDIVVLTPAQQNQVLYNAVANDFETVIKKRFSKTQNYRIQGVVYIVKFRK